MIAPAVPVRLAGSILDRNRHVCAFFASEEEEYRVLLPFIRDGLACSDYVVNIMPRSRTGHLAHLRANGIDVDAAQGRGQFEVLDAEETYTPGGQFDQDAMLARLETMLEAARREGFAVSRVVGHPGHVLGNSRNADAFLEYEARVNRLAGRHPDALVCVYDITRTSAGVAMDALRTHPLVIVGDMLHENPFFVPPEVLLGELHGHLPAVVLGAPAPPSGPPGAR